MPKGGTNMMTPFERLAKPSVATELDVLKLMNVSATFFVLLYVIMRVSVALLEAS